MFFSKNKSKRFRSGIISGTIILSLFLSCGCSDSMAMSDETFPVKDIITIQETTETTENAQ